MFKYPGFYTVTLRLTRMGDTPPPSNFTPRICVDPVIFEAEMGGLAQNITQVKI